MYAPDFIDMCQNRGNYHIEKVAGKRRFSNVAIYVFLNWKEREALYLSGAQVTPQNNFLIKRFEFLNMYTHVQKLVSPFSI